MPNTMSKRSKLSTSKNCCFCGLSKNSELEYGKFYQHDDILTHYYCLLLSSNMQQRGNDDQGILGFLVKDIREEVRRGKRLVCSYCKKAGATLGCCNVKCKKIFHYPCGLRAGTLNQFFGEFRSYCIKHRPQQDIDKQVLDELVRSNEVVCYICYDQVDPYDTVNTMWAPCCKKNAWFHRTCVQQLAMSAGYFFKCPLCNDKKIFQKAMLQFGIFIPSQDASWELVPNAFQELLYRHDQCDAPVCICPKGRKYTSFNAKWELALCRTCGSQGIHMACGQLKWANPMWECTECISILGKSKETANSVASTTRDTVLQNSPDSEDSDTDISVGKDSPISFSSNLLLTSSMPHISPIKLRPGPRSSKLKQLQRNKEIQNNNKQEINEIISTVSCATSTGPHSLQPTSSKRDVMNAACSVIDTVLQSYKDDFKSSVEHPISQLGTIASNITSVDRNENNALEISNCTLLNNTFSITKGNECDENNSYRFKNNTIERDKSRILYNPSLPKAEKLLEKSNLNENDTFLTENLNINKTHNLKEVDSQNEIKSRVSNDAMQLKHEDEDACTDLISNIKITNVISLACEEFENASVEKKQETNMFEYLTLQNGNGLMNSNSLSQSLSSQNDTPELFSKRKIDTTTLSPAISYVNVSKKMRRNNGVLTETLQSSNENNVEFINVNDFPDVPNLQNRELYTQVKQNGNINENILHLFNERNSLGMNASNNVLSDNTDTFATSINKESRVMNSKNETILTPGNNRVDKQIRNCDGHAGTSPAAESRNKRSTDDTRINCTSESLESKCVKECFTNRRVSEKHEVPNKSNTLWQEKDRNTYCNYSRLMSEYIRLRDLKFRVNNINDLQVILYDKFSVNIKMKCAPTENSTTTNT
ncbi:uncharacterized protein LOC143425718 [Xylocopa sonorina]|uniref:uncharacterized protein LOC143425718 n=1 Tax=Xylocopa sonorina TaxID=1818115 RepID=UPI00403AD792